MAARRAELPAEEAAARAALDALVQGRAARWCETRAALAARLEQLDAARLAGSTGRTAVVEAWLPRRDLPALREALAARLGADAAVEEMPSGRGDRAAPVLLQNRRPARPFELLVRVYDDPRARSLDPTGLVAIFLPLMFGLMVGDVVYGALLLVASLVALRRLGPRSPAIRDLARAFALGSVWAIAFGVVFGEALGDLGESAFGMPAVWMHRDDEDAVQALLLLAVAIGAVHVTLGVLLGLWQSWRDRATHGMLGHLGTLLVLTGLFALAGVAAGHLPAAAGGAAAAVAVVGLVLVSALHGRLGILLGPLEVVGVVGNVLSYLRLAAVGLASVYLAVVANELAGLGPIWMGALIATFLHALNLALASFTPAIQAVRLQYVEFFTKFFVGGGRAFRPFGAVPD
jgi:V/A-type H+-transporting ATPase subunit I